MNSIVLVTIYTTKLNEAEYISLQQVFRIFPREMICYCIPEDLDLKRNNKIPDAKSERFDNKYFKDVYGYSQLLMSSKFYERFDEYEYILIVQLDAFVFSDRLSDFCDYKYDYIGARVPQMIWPYLNHRVGNGGFSLRKTKSCLKVCNRKKEILSRAKSFLNKDDYASVSMVEDQFFAFCGNEYPHEFRLAPYEIAELFSVEFNVADVYDRLACHLPFGCHRWYQSYLGMWWQHIKEYGYSLSNDFFEKWNDCLSAYDYQRFFTEKLTVDNKKIYRKLLDDLVGEKKLIIWGDGTRGRKLCFVLKNIGYDDYLIVDKKYINRTVKNGERYYPINEIVYEKSFIVITPLNARLEIKKALECKGMRKNKEYITFNGLIKEFLAIV